MLCVVWPPGLHTLPVALLLLSVMLLPAQKLDGPLIVGVAGALFTVTLVPNAFDPQVFVAVSVYVPVLAPVTETSSEVLFGLNVPVPAQLNVIGSVPVTVAFNVNAVPLQIGLFVRMPVTTGAVQHEPRFNPAPWIVLVT
jgi:hypothetical protein